MSAKAREKNEHSHMQNSKCRDEKVLCNTECIESRAVVVSKTGENVNSCAAKRTSPHVLGSDWAETIVQKSLIKNWKCVSVTGV